MELNEVLVDLGLWRNLEILCLIVCCDVFLDNVIFINLINLKVLYNYVVEFEIVNFMLFVIFVKLIV